MEVSINSHNIRSRFEQAFVGEPVDWPVYAVYDWFVEHRAIDWPGLFEQGLGQIKHANLVEVRRPNLKVIETTHQTERGIRRDVRWITDRGELHESYLGEWRQEHLVKSPKDYEIVRRALEGTEYTATDEPFRRSETVLGNGGITLGQLMRTPLMAVQIDLAGLERFSMDLADERPELMELLELMTDLLLQQIHEAAKTSTRYVKLWENLSIETIGPCQYRRRLVPLYRKILDILDSADKRLLVHYDGKLRTVADDIAALGIDGMDSLTPPPEGDMSIAEARSRWPNKFLWLHPPLGWYREEPSVLTEHIKQMIRDAGPRRFCLMISEDVPTCWQQTVPLVLRTLQRSSSGSD